ncbi:MAG: hypothetical protein U0457_14410 [Candidatus Sericytochromatia bacterium]
MSSLSVSNLLISIGVAFDAQLKAADNLFFSAAVDFSDPTRPMFGGSVGDPSGNAVALYTTNAVGYASVNNPVSGDPVTVRQISSAEGPRYLITDSNGREVKVENTATANGQYRNTPRYIVKSDGIIYDVLAVQNASGTGAWGIVNPASSPPTGLGADPGANAVTLQNYAKPVGRITFKAKEGATLARAQDDLQRTGTIVQLLTRLLESIQSEAQGFASLIR